LSEILKKNYQIEALSSNRVATNINGCLIFLTFIFFFFRHLCFIHLMDHHHFSYTIELKNNERTLVCNVVKKYRRMNKHCISYLIYSQIWLNLFMHDCRFGCIERLLEKTLLFVAMFFISFFFK
jgi:hypothetical protein